MFNLVSTRSPRSFPAKLLSSWVSPACACVCLPRFHHFALPIVKLQICISPFLQLVECPLDGSTTMCGVSATPPIFWDLCRLAKFAHYTIIQVINEATEQDCTRYWPLGYTSRYWLPDGFGASFQSVSLSAHPSSSLWGSVRRLHQKPCRRPCSQYSPHSCHLPSELFHHRKWCRPAPLLEHLAVWTVCWCSQIHVYCDTVSFMDVRF